jgi:YesN/AraC family two-component response regulator
MWEKILFVDDEPQVLEGFQRLLSASFRIDTAISGKEALTKLKRNGPYAVVVCDMRMPEMDGVQLLYKIKLEFPDAVRIMLTGNSDQLTAARAVNEGGIFRFLTKPCEEELLTKALNDALIQYRLANRKEDLLDKARSGYSIGLASLDPTGAGFREVEEKVQELLAGQARTFEPLDNAIYVGKTIWVTREYVLQCLSPTRVIVHRKDLLTKLPAVGEFVRIEYINGQGQVKEIAL